MAIYKENTMDYELRMWKKKVEAIIDKFDSLPTRKKAKLMGYIREIDILAAELDDRIYDLRTWGDDGGDFWINDVKVDIDEFRSDFTETSGTYMDYDYSG